MTTRGTARAAHAITVVEAVDAEFFGDEPSGDVVALLQRLAAVSPGALAEQR